MTRFLRRLLVAMLLGVLVYGAFALYTGLAQMQASLASFRWSHLAWALSLSSTNYLIRYLKWEYYLRLLGVRGVLFLDSLLIFLSGFVLTVTPGKVGEVFKSAVLQRTHDVPVARTAPIVVAERLTDALGVVVLIVLGSTAFTGGGGWALAGGVAVALGITAIVWEKPVRTCLSWLGTRGGKLAGLVPKLSEAYASLRVVASPSALLIPTFLSCIAWGLEGIALYLILRGFGADVPLPRAVFFYSTATLAGALVPLPGGLGIVEGIIREQLVHVSHVQDGPATASMILIRFATLWWAVVVGFGALLVLRVRYKERLADESSLAAPVTR